MALFPSRHRCSTAPRVLQNWTTFPARRRWNEAAPRKQLCSTSFHFGHHPAGLIPTPGLIGKTMSIDFCPITSPESSLANIHFHLILQGSQSDFKYFLHLIQELPGREMADDTAKRRRYLAWPSCSLSINPNSSL